MGWSGSHAGFAKRLEGGPRGTRMLASRLSAALVAVVPLTVTSCSTSSLPTATPAVAPSVALSSATTDVSPDGAPAYALGEFPAFPRGTLARSTSLELQAVLDAAVKGRTFRGITASVIVADRGSWTGAAGSDHGAPLTPGSALPTHSAGKNVVAAEVLRLAEKGELDLSAPAADLLPPELGFFDANGATVRQVLQMRSGIPTLDEESGFYPAEKAATVVKVFKKLPESDVRPGTETEYASTNYVLLGAIIEQVTGQPLSTVLRADVLAHPGLAGLVYTVDGALAADGWGVETTSASLARWGYDLYGGFVLSKPSLRAMTNFKGEWYGLGTMDFSSAYGTSAVGHDGESSVTTCCSNIRLVALPEEGVVISVQANSAGVATADPWAEVEVLTVALRDVVSS